MAELLGQPLCGMSTSVLNILVSIAKLPNWSLDKQCMLNTLILMAAMLPTIYALPAHLAT